MLILKTYLNFLIGKIIVTEKIHDNLKYEEKQILINK